MILSDLHNHIQDLCNGNGTLVLGNKKAWNNKDLMINQIIKYFKDNVEKRYPPSQRIIFVFDNFRGHIHEEVLMEFQRKSIYTI